MKMEAGGVLSAARLPSTARDDASCRRRKPVTVKKMKIKMVRFISWKTPFLHTLYRISHCLLKGGNGVILNVKPLPPLLWEQIKALFRITSQMNLSEVVFGLVHSYPQQTTNLTTTSSLHWDPKALALIIVTLLVTGWLIQTWDRPFLSLTVLSPSVLYFRRQLDFL